MRSDGLIERSRFAGAHAIDAILVGVGHNIHLLLAWLTPFAPAARLHRRRDNRRRRIGSL